MYKVAEVVKAHCRRSPISHVRANSVHVRVIRVGARECAMRVVGNTKRRADELARRDVDEMVVNAVEDDDAGSILLGLQKKEERMKRI